MRDDSLTIVTVAKEPLHITLRFVAWHRQQGVDHIRIYLDDPDDPAIPFLEPLDFVTIIRCTPEFWQSIDVETDAYFTKRQNAALTHGYRSASAGWVGVLDADELFYSRSSPLNLFLAEQSPDTRSVRFLTAETVHSDVPGQHFRTAMTKHQCHDLYGGAAGYVKRHGGLVGHSLGKSITKAGLPVSTIRQHFAVQEDGEPLIDLTVGREQSTYLLHFVDNGYDGWLAKLDWRMKSWGYNARMMAGLREILQQHADPHEELLKFYNALYHLSEAQIALMQSFGAHLLIEGDVMAPAQQLFPDAFVNAQ